VRRATLLVAALVAVLLAAGCGSDGIPTSGNSASGETLFKEQCGSCHTLAAAGTKGQVGPNLDDAFRQSRLDGLGENTIAAVVRNQIAYPTTKTVTGAPGMPAELLGGQDADDVATYVASVAGLPGAAAAPAPPPPAGTTSGGGTTTGGGEAGGGKQSGKTIFESAGCSGCHTLADAGATGNVGPNLDDAKPSKDLVVDRVTNGMGVMPSFKGQLTDAEIQAVADYVSSAAGK
jgi:mono/diheme cytochrome c family protein